MTDLTTFRIETRAWLEENCPQAMRNLSFHWEDAHLIYSTEAAEVWRERMAGNGWIAPMWPTAYGGGGRGHVLYPLVLYQYCIVPLLYSHFQALRRFLSSK